MVSFYICTVHLPASFWVFLHYSEEKELFSAHYPLVWYVLKQIVISVSLKSGRYLPRLLVSFNFGGAFWRNLVFHNF